jgi:hypothetical protein
MLPIDIPSLVRAVIWPVITIVGLVAFRQSIATLIGGLGQRVKKLAFAGFSLEMAQVQEMRPSAMDTEIRQLETGLVPQSGSNALTALVKELESGGNHDYVVIDLGSEPSPRWLTSRLYLLCLLIATIHRQPGMVFTETLGAVRKRFIGMASPEEVRWALARRYGWLESAGASAYAMQVANPPIGYLPNPTPANQFDPATGYLSMTIPNLIQQFLALVRSPVPPMDGSPDKLEWLSIGNAQTFEHAKWVNGNRIETLLGSDLNRARVTLPPNKTISDLVSPVLAQQGRFVAVLDPDSTFLCLVDRHKVLEAIAREFTRQQDKGEKV